MEEKIFCALPYYEYTRTSILIARQPVKSVLPIAMLGVYSYGYTRSMAMHTKYYRF